MQERLSAIVGARIAEFKKKMAEVKAIVSNLEKDDAVKDITADVSDFKSNLAEARNRVATFASTDAAKKLTLNKKTFESNLDRAKIGIATFPDGKAELKLDTDNFRKNLNMARARLATYTSADAKKTLNLDTAKFSRKMNSAQVAAVKFASNDASKDLNADASNFYRKILAAEKKARSFNPKTIWVSIKVRHKQFTKDMDRIADAFRDLNIVGAEMSKGLVGVMIPALATVGAGFVAAGATAGVQLGVIAGGALALASSFSLALAGAIGFGAALTPLIFDIKAARDAILSGDKALEDFSKPMQHAQLGLIAMKATFNNLTNAIRPYALEGMGTAMYALGDVMTAVKPGIVAISKVFNTLMTDLRNVIKNSEDVQASFKWFNERAAGAVEAWAKIAGYAFRGFVNLMRAFDPLAKSVEGGLLNMTKRFSEWSAGLSKSDKFKQFMQYVRENGPKLISSIGNIITAIINIGVAFAPLAADMMTGFQKLTQRFKEWSAALGENKNFQAFVQYVRDNGPQIKQLIANIVDVGYQLVTALGRVGETMLPVINRILELTTGFLKANPHVANMIVGIGALMSAFKVIAPVIATFRLMFGGAFSVIWKAFQAFKPNMIIGLKMLGSSMMTLVKGAFTQFKLVLVTGLKMLGNKLKLFGIAVFNASKKVLKQFGVMMKNAAIWAGKMALQMGKVVAKYAWLGIKALFHAGKVAASWLIAMGPVGWVIATVVALVALIIANWDKVKKWTKQAWSAVSSWISEKWNQIVSFTKTAAQLVWQWVKDKFNAAKDAISNALNSAWSFIKSIWNSIKSYISEKASAIWSTVKNKFADMVSAVQEKMNAVWDKVENIWGNIQDFFSNIDLFDIGADIISGLINGIGSMASALWEKARSIASGIGDAIKGALGIHSPSRVTMALGEYTGQGLYKGMNRTISKIKQASNQLAYAAIPSISSPTPPSFASISTPSYSGGNMDGLMSGGTTHNDNRSTGPVTINIYDAEDDTIKEIKRFFGTFEQSARQM